MTRTRNVLSVILLTALIGSAVYLFAEPMRREARLRTASLANLRSMVEARPDDSRLLFYLGRRYRESGDLAAAYEVLTRAADHAPRDAEIWILTAETARALNGLQGAHDLLAAFLKNNPDSVPGRLAMAEQYFREQQEARGEQEARDILKADPKNADAWRLVGLAHLSRHEIADSEAAMQKAVALGRANPRAHANLGDVLLEKREYQKAAQAYRRALDLQPDHAGANLMCALALLSADPSPAVAKQALELALNGLRLDDGNFMSHYVLGVAYHRNGDAARAGQELDTARLMAPTYAETYFRLAELARQQKRNADADIWRQRHRALLAFQSEKDIRQKRNREAAKDRDRLRERAVEFARWLGANGDFTAAISIYQDLIREDASGALNAELESLLRTPACRDFLLLNTPTPLLLKQGEQLTAQERLPQALTVYTAAIRRNRTRAESFEKAGQAALTMGNPLLAVRFLKEGLRIEPRRARSYFALASLAADLRLDGEARWYAEQGLRWDAKNADAWYLLGDMQRGDVKRAEECFARAVEYAPENARYQAALGEMQAANNRRDAARVSFAAALRLGPDVPEVLLAYGAFLTGENGRLAEAVDVLEKARRLSPDDAYIAYRLGLAYTRNGETGRAIEALEAAKNGPLERDAAYALATLYNKKGDRVRSDAYRAQATQLQTAFLETARLEEKTAVITPELRLKLARVRARTPRRVQALSDYEAYLILRPKDTQARQERDTLQRALEQEGILLPQNAIETVMELQNHADLPIPPNA